MKILPQVFYFMQKAAGMLQKSSHHMVTAFWYGRQDLNLHGCPLEPKSNVSANSTTPALGLFYHEGGCLSTDNPFLSSNRGGVPYLVDNWIFYTYL